MKLIVSISVFILALSSCQTSPDQAVVPASKTYSNAREDINRGDILREANITSDDILVATVVARRDDEKQDDYCQTVFKENPECQAIFVDIESGYYFGYVKDFPQDQTVLKAISCGGCEKNGIVITIKQPMHLNYANRYANSTSSTTPTTARTTPIGAWLSAILWGN